LGVLPFQLYCHTLSAFADAWQLKPTPGIAATAAARLGVRALPLCLQRHKRVICSVCSWLRDGARQVSLLAGRTVDLIVVLC